MIAGWLVVMALLVFLATRRRIAALPQPKRASAYAAFALGALVFTALAFVIWLAGTALFFCTPPGCF
jgi:hypothetical protein